MAKVGKWGIARDENGELAEPWTWAWSWRYLFGVALIAASVAFRFYADADTTSLRSWIMPGIGIIFALIMMYELGCLALVVIGAAALWAFGDAFIPDVEIPLNGKLGILAAMGVVAWSYGYAAFEQAKKNGQAIDNIWQRLNRLEGDPFAERSTGLAHIGERLYRVEGRIGMHDPEEWEDS